MNLIDHFLDYVSYDTQSSEKSGNHPSTPGQLVLAHHLAEELKMIGMKNIRISEQGYVFAELPPCPGFEKVPALGWIAHMDTSDAASGQNIKAQKVLFEGTPVPLKNGKVIHPEKHLAGHTLITTDGTTLLGADDKAGIAEIITAMETVIKEKRFHGKLCVGFTPDEEIGEGPMFFDISSFGADFAFTMDGGAVGEIEYSNFNAAAAHIQIHGNSTHPGTAKGLMVNALRVAYELDSLLPDSMRPETTTDREGFFHLSEMNGTVSSAEMNYLIRDHDAALFEQKKEMLMAAGKKLNEKYGDPTIQISIREQYRNMEEVILKHPLLIQIAEESIRKAGLIPKTNPIRGGTDGATLSLKGLPCPNLGTGGYGYHGECEYASVQEMHTAVEIILNIIKSFSERGRL